MGSNPTLSAMLKAPVQPTQPAPKGASLPHDTPEARATAEVKLMGGSDPAKQNEMLDLARGIYK